MRSLVAGRRQFRAEAFSGDLSMVTQLLKAFRATLPPASQNPPAETSIKRVTPLTRTAAQLTPKARPRVQPRPRRYRQRYRFAPA